MLKFGNICDIDAAKGLARVEFDDDGITSAWLPVVTLGSSGNKYSHAFDVNEHVACLMDENAENGVIIGAIYSNAAQPDGGNKDNVRVKFSDGAEVQYDRAASKLTVKVGTTELDVTEDGFTVKRGGETLKAILTDLIDAILAETHPTGTGPSGTPINAAQYTAIKNRLPNLFQ
ncbi:MAG: phage baseplate assembly protein V [Saprospiraceae bacterium]